MTNNTFGSYSATNTIDAAADYLLISPSNSNVYKRINRNTLLGLASAPLGLTDIQSPQNKIFDNTNSLTVKDGSLTIQNSSSTTKQAVFSAAGITAGQTRTFTLPDASGTLATIAGTQTLTNKTITSPAITGGTIDNSTITVDSISGHSVATTVTVGNLQIANGVLNTNNSVVTANVTDSAITPAKLQTGTGSGWAFSSWTPSWTNLTVGNATVSYGYVQTGKMVNFRLSVTFGSTSAMGSGGARFSLPVATNAAYNQSMLLGFGAFDNVGTQAYVGALVWIDANTVEIRPINPNNYVNFGVTTTTSTIPFTFGTGSRVTANGCYEAA